MNKLKFRAFEKSLKEIIHVSSIDFDRKMINIEGAWRLFDEVVLMQSTGLLDKNGVEIFEGDLLKCCSGYKWLVCFKHDQGSFVATNPHDSSYYDFVFLDDLEFKVIGNIHTNPELLGETQ